MRTRSFATNSGPMFPGGLRSSPRSADAGSTNPSLAGLSSPPAESRDAAVALGAYGVGWRRAEWAVGKPGARALTAQGLGPPGPRGRALPARPPRAGAGPGRRPKLVKNPAVSESSSFPTSERQTSPLLLYYNAEPDGLLGVASPAPPRRRPHSFGGRPRH